MYWCRTLGELALYAGSSQTRPLLRAGKSLAILTYVGLTPQRAACRDRIASLFWPSKPLPQAHHALRQALYRVRQSAGDEALIELQDNFVRCSPDVRFDCLEAEEALAAEDVGRAWTLLRGEFLEGLPDPDSLELAEWIEAQRARFREIFKHTAEALIEREIATGKPETVIGVAEELHAANPLEERPTLLLMRALDCAGQTRRALAEYRAHSSLLASALEDEPSDELRGYAAELERSLEPLLPNGSTILPFVGRSRAWSVLLDALTSAEAAECSVVLIEGDAGLGKTRLIEEFAARARARGTRWLSGKCYEMERVLPFAVVSHAVRSAAGGDEPTADDVAPINEALFGQANVHQGATGGAGLRLREGFVSWLENLAAEAPVLLTCDDIHWADPASLRLLHFARKGLARSRLLLVCSYRPAELSPVARRFAGSLASEDLARIVTLDPLTTDDVSEILRTLGRFEGAQLEHALAADLHRHTGGNPLFIAELLEALEADGLLRLESGRWTATAHLRAEELPKTLRKALTDRVDGLAPDLRFALEVMAVHGEPADSQLLALALGGSPPKAEAIMAELVRHRLLRRRRFDTYEIAHDELRQLVYAAIPDNRRREIHTKVAAALEERGEAARPGGAARLARHLEQAGEAGGARRYALAAAGEAEAVGAAEARQSFLQLAEALSPGEGDDGWDGAGDSPKKKEFPWRSAAAGAVLVAATSLVVAGLALDGSGSRAAARPWEQGTLYIEEVRRGAIVDEREALYRVVWPTESDGGRLLPISSRPADLPPELRAGAVAGDSHTPGKIFRFRDGRPVQLTSGNADDALAVWSPDRRWIALQRGWREGSTYRFNLFVIDSMGATLWQATEGDYQDELIDWSPDGGRLAFSRNDGGKHQLWVTDIDGGRAINLTAEFDLPKVAHRTGEFSPDGRELAVVQGGSSIIEIIDLVRGLSRRIDTGCLSLGWPSVVWSPDGEWLAAACVTAAGRYLAVLAADGTSGPHVILELNSEVRELHTWAGAPSAYVKSLEIRSPQLKLTKGDGLRLSTEALTPSGTTAFPWIRWEAMDTSVASVDSLGFLRALDRGSTRIVASAGGFSSDTLTIEVWDAPIDTLLYETWEAGIDTTRWRVVGSPLPEIVPGAGRDGSPALLSNGDDRWPSGLLSVREFDLRPGLTVESWVELRYTGQHWQEVEIGLLSPSDAVVMGERNTNGLVDWWMAGPSPTYQDPQIQCRSGGQATGVEWDLESAHSGWHHIVLQVRQDGRAECYLDGELLVPFRAPEIDHGSRVVLFVGGRSHETRIYHGPVVVTGGLRYY